MNTETSNLPAVPAAFYLPQQPDVPRYDYASEEMGCFQFIFTLMALGGSGWLFFVVWPMVYFLIIPVAISIIGGSIWLTFNITKENDNNKR